MQVMGLPGSYKCLPKLNFQHTCTSFHCSTSQKSLQKIFYSLFYENLMAFNYQTILMLVGGLQHIQLQAFFEYFDVLNIIAKDVRQLQSKSCFSENFFSYKISFSALNFQKEFFYIIAEYSYLIFGFSAKVTLTAGTVLGVA